MNLKLLISIEKSKTCRFINLHKNVPKISDFSSIKYPEMLDLEVQKCPNISWPKRSPNSQNQRSLKVSKILDRSISKNAPTNPEMLDLAISKKVPSLPKD